MKTKTIIFFIILLFSKLYAENQKTFLHFYGREGEIINAISDGVIKDLGFDEEKGMFVTVNYEEIGMSVTYCNLKSFFVKKRQHIKKGEKIATIGMTGNVVNAGVNLSIVSVNSSLNYSTHSPRILKGVISMFQGSSLFQSSAV